MFDYMVDAYGSSPVFGSLPPAELQQALRERYRLEMKVKSLEHAVKCGDPEKFDARMQELDEARKEFCAVAEHTGRLMQRWNQKKAEAEWASLYPKK